MSKSRDTTRQKIVDAFLVLYTKNRQKTLTIGEVMKKAGFHRGTFYRYFDSIDDLHKLVIDATIWDDKRSPAEFIEILKGDYDQVMIDYLQDETNIFVLTSNERDLSNQKRNIELLMPHFREAFACEENSQLLEYAFAYLVGGGSFVLRLWHDNQMDFPLECIVKLLTFLNKHGPYSVLRINEPENRTFLEELQEINRCIEEKKH